MLTKLLNSKGEFFKKNILNILWLSLDRFLRLAVGLFLGIAIAKYLGPAQFGKLNYVTALCGLLSVFSTLGLEQIVVKKLVEGKLNQYEVLGTALGLRLFGSLLLTLFSFLYIIFFTTYDREILILLFLTTSFYSFLSFEIFDYYYQSLVKSKKSVIPRNISFAICAVIKLILLLNKASLISFASIILLENVLSTIGLFGVYGLTEFKKWRFRSILVKSILKECTPLILANIAILIYMRIDQVMIGQMLNNTAVGVYSAAVRIAEIFYFIPSIINSTFYPQWVEKKQTDLKSYKKSFNFAFRILFYMSLVLSIGITLFSSQIVGLLYGKKFIEAASVLQVNVWTCVFVFIGIASNSFLLIENLSKITLYKSIIGAIANVILNIYLIPKYGIIGAAYATLISQGISAYFADLLFKKTRMHFWDITKSFFFIS